MNRRARPHITLALAAVLALGFATACETESKSPRERGASQLEEGGELGEIERRPGGTAVATDVRTLVSVTCTDGTLFLRTSAELVRASMPCDRMPPQSIIDKFVSQTIAVRYADGRLTMDSVTAGTLELPATDPQVFATDATP